MRLPFRIASAMLAVSLAVSAFCMPASAAKYSTLTFPDAAGNQVTYLDQQYQDIAELPIGTQIILTGMPDYNAAYNDGQYNYVGFNTDKGTWYIRLGSSSVDALKKIVPDDGSITEFTACGTYVGLLAANGLPVIDLALGQALVYNAQAGGDTVHALADELPRYQQEIDATRVYLRSQKCWDIRQKAPDARRMSAALLGGMQANATQQMGLFGRIEQRWGVFRYTLGLPKLPPRSPQPSRPPKRRSIPAVDCPMYPTRLLASWFGFLRTAALNITLIPGAAV